MFEQSEQHGLTAQTAHQIERTSPVRTVHRLEDLDAIFDDEADAVIWSRQAPPTVLSALKALPAYEVENGRFCVPVSGVGDCIINLFDAWGWCASPVRNWVAGDVEALAGQMATILSISHVLLRVEVVRDDACRKFHRDTVRARLICTYSGPGTELGIIAEDGGYPRPIGAVAAGSPILLKGKRWQGAKVLSERVAGAKPRTTLVATRSAQKSVVHRSPPIEETGVSRLVVVLDEASPPLTEPAITP